MKTAGILAVTLLLSTSAVPAFAYVNQGQLSLSPSVGGYTFDSRQHLKTSPVYGLRAGYMLSDAVGVEATFDYAITRSTQAPKDVALFKYGADLLYHFMPEKSFVPFVAIGAAGTNLSGPRNLVSKDVRPAFDYGAGFKYLFSDSLGVRTDLRHVITSYSSKTYNNLEYTLGLHIPFGGSKPAPKQVTHQVPEEPVTLQPVRPAEPVRQPEAAAPAEAAQPKAAEAAPAPAPAPAPAEAAPAPATVTPIPSAPATDADGDGIPDAIDLCPGTAAGVAVDRNGCPAPASAGAKPESAASAVPPAATAERPVLTGIVAGDGFIDIQVDGLSGFKTMRLSKPERLAIDLPGAKSSLPRKSVEIKRMGVSSARIGIHPEYVRIVLDAPKGAFPAYQIKERSGGLRIEFK